MVEESDLMALKTTASIKHSPTPYQINTNPNPKAGLPHSLLPGTYQAFNNCMACQKARENII